ncbi:MAG: hypothetical protein M3065_07660, partial [Actinomycetota bacterium]|nr:hypothetical protein [Actinomycetota bacterium]
MGANGRLGYGNTTTIGDNELPASVGPVDVGLNRAASAISAGGAHTCARLDDASVRCLGSGANGRLGYCNQNDIGDDEPPAAAGPVALQQDGRGAACAEPPSGGGTSPS